MSLADHPQMPTRADFMGPVVSCEIMTSDKGVCAEPGSDLRALLKHPGTAQPEASGFGDMCWPGNFCQLLFEEPR